MDLREKIIHETLKLFSLKGYSNTSIEDILAQTHASKGGFYNHFKSKDQLFMTVLSEARKIWRSRVLDGLEQTSSPCMKLRKFLENFRDLYLKDSENIPGGCVFVTLLVELDDQRPDFAREISEGFSRVLSMMNRLLEQAKASGELRADVNTEAVSRVLFLGLLGASVLYGMDKSSEELGKSVAPLIQYLDALVDTR
ncbi:MAG: TetR/AcrR family transcriptional regulator [Desulfomonile tiedjei]|nr:TetR/AcrR family transcriptional regulator [Desulfomonile tiedjei]